MKKVNNILVNWKTSGAGFVAIIAGLLVSFNVISDAQGWTDLVNNDLIPALTGLSSTISGVGLLIARDSDKSSQDNGVR